MHGYGLAAAALCGKQLLCIADAVGGQNNKTLMPKEYKSLTKSHVFDDSDLVKLIDPELLKEDGACSVSSLCFCCSLNVRAMQSISEQWRRCTNGARQAR